MTFDRNPKPVQFIQPNVLDRACLPSVRTTVLPINSDCAAPYSFKIFEGTGASPMALRVPIRPSRLCCRRRSLSQRSALGMMDGDCSSNSRSRSICALRLAGSSGSSFMNAASLSPICWHDCSAVLGIYVNAVAHKKPRSGNKAPALAPPSCSSPACEHGWQF